MSAYVFRPAAAADVADGYLWYESQRIGLGEEFLVEVHRVASNAAENPARHPVILRDTRRALLRRFPYSLLFRVYDDHVLVVACMHVRRDPIRWRERQ